MKKFYLIHGFESLPNRGFFPWLMHNLFTKMKACATALEMPNPEDPIVSEWVEKIRSEVKKPNLEKYLVGHSLGVPAILRYLETIPEGEKIGAVFLVAGFMDKLDESEKEPTIRKIDNFVTGPFNFEHIKKVCGKFFVIHGDNDTVVPIFMAQKLAKELEISPLIIKGAGHFQSSKVFELPELLDLTLKEIK
jgi:predicted alpha/beta hydrolase family esterase